MKLYILRHGQTDWNIVRRLQGRTDIPLNEHGRVSAHACGRGMKREDIRFDSVISSPLVRSQETARILLEELGYQDGEIPFGVDEDIVELGFGSYEGYSALGNHPEFGLTDPDWHFFFDDPARYKAPEGGENFDDLIARTRHFLEKLRKQAESETKNGEAERRLLISTHGCASRALLYHMVQPTLPLSDFWQGKVPPNCAVSIAQSDGGPWKLLEKDVIFDEDL